MIALYIPLEDCQAYQEDGWTVERLPGNHGAYSALATRPCDYEQILAEMERIETATKAEMKNELMDVVRKYGGKGAVSKSNH